MSPAPPIRVMKFGGTSVAGAERLRSVVRLVAAAAGDERVLVVASAFAGITDLLVEGLTAAERGEAGGAAAARRFAAAYGGALAELRRDLVGEAAGESAGEAAQRLAALADELDRLFAGTAILRTCPPAARARICAMGERATCVLLAPLLRAAGLEVEELDPAALIVCEGETLDATPLPAVQRERWAAFRAGTVRVGLLPGFFGGRVAAPSATGPGTAESAGNAAGPATTGGREDPTAAASEVVLLGRGGSDLSAALAAAAVEARLLEIWTDVDGIFTADPRLVPSAACLAELSFDEATELAHFGAKVLHPRTIAAVRAQGIPVVVRSSLAPERPGTTVHAAAAPSELPARGVSLLRGVALLDVSGPAMRGMPGTAARIFTSLGARVINVALITQGSSEAAISVCVAAAQAGAARAALDGAFAVERAAGLMNPVALRHGLAILTLVGDGMRHQPGVAGALFGALGDLDCNIAAIAQGSSERSISAVIAEEEGARAIEAVHARFFHGAERLELYLLGVGLVGRQLLVQLAGQQERLRRGGVDLRLCAVANSRRMRVDAAGLPPGDVSGWLAESGEAGVASEAGVTGDGRTREGAGNAPLDLAALRAAVRRRRPACPVLVDCTSSAELAGEYGEFAAAGFHLVSANKKLNSGPLAAYQALRTTLVRHRRRFHYETNVGAGLPVLGTLRDLLAGGDRVRRIEGILSGSLSFIAGLLEDDVPLSAAVERARDAGFTEPDPRDDLSGLDVARKALILHRELGGALELAQVQLEGLVPALAAAAPPGTSTGSEAETGAGERMPWDELRRQLVQLDAGFAARLAELRRRGEVLRFLAVAEAQGCRVGPQAIGPGHPLFAVRDGECAVSFDTAAYSPRPLVVRGYGAGAEVTAAAVLADVMRLVQGVYA